MGSIWIIMFGQLIETLILLFILIIIVFLVFIFSVHIVYGGTYCFEREYQELYCHGKKEVVLSDKSRVDCIQAVGKRIYAIEIDFAKKWAEAIGQALYYSAHTDLYPGIVLILESKSDYRYYIRVSALLQYHELSDVEVWLIENYDGSYCSHGGNNK